MENIFLYLLNMSLTAGILVAVVLVLRLVFFKAPRWIHCLLWALVAVRLLCPFAIESNFSLMPSAATVPMSVVESTPELPATQPVVPDTPAPSKPIVNPPMDTPIADTPIADTPVIDTPSVDTPIINTPVASPSTNVVDSTPTPETGVDPWQVILSITTWVWLAGMLAMAAYAVITTLRLHRQVREAAHLRDNLWQCDHLRSPFILGVFRPRIYLPSDLNGVMRDSVVAHEQAHLHRRDHWWKPLGFLLLTVYWFNPLMWVAYILLCRDIEAACDERVVRDMNADSRRSYSEALLACSAPRRLVSACPLAFGETSVKSRIRSVLSYKKPTIWIIVAALLVSTVAGVCLLTDPKSDKPDKEADSKTSITNKPTDLPIDTDESKYVVFVHNDRPMAQIRLERDGINCTYTPSTLSSRMAAEGTYVMEGDKVTLTFADLDMILVFKGDFTGLTFCDADSRYQEEYLTFGGYTLPDGAAFERRMDVSATAPLGLTRVIRTGLDDEDLEQYFGSPGVQQFHSQEELLAFLTPRQEGDQEWLGVQWEVGDFDLFDDAFFADNVLLLTHHTTSSGMFTPEVVGYTYAEDDTVLIIEFVEYHPGFATDDIGNWLMFTGIRKADLEGVTELKAHHSKDIPTDTYVAAFTEPTEHPEKAVEKWRQWLPTDEGWALGILMNEWDDAARWGDAQSVNRAFDFATAFNLHGHIHYLATDYSALLRDDGALLWLNEAEGAFLRWIAAYYDEDNKELLYLASSHPTSYDRRYAAVPVVLTSPELKAIVSSDRWEEVRGDISSYGRFTLGGTVYHIDRTRECIVYANDDHTTFYAVYLTAEELAVVDGILASTPWAHTDYMVGKVTQVFAEDDSVTVKLTDSSKYTSDISDGTEVRVSLRYYVGEMPAVGSSIRVTYDGYLGSYYDGERYHPLIHAHSVAVTAQPTGTTTPPATKPTTQPTNPSAPTQSTTSPTMPEVTKTATVVFNSTIKNKMTERQIEKLFGASSVVSIDSSDALKAFHKTHINNGLPIFAEDYDAAFFEEHALLLTYHETASGIARPRAAVYTYSADGTVLSVAVDEFWPYDGLVTDDIGEWVIVSVIKKTDLKGVAKLTSHFRARIPDDSISFLVNPAVHPQNSAVKGSKAMTSFEGDVLHDILYSTMIDEEWGTWNPSPDVLFDVQLVLNGDTYYYDIDSGIIIATEGRAVYTMFWTACFGKLAARTNMIDWVLARYSDTNDEVWIWEDFESNYYANDARLLNTPEMRSIALRTNWTKNDSLNRTYDAQYTIGGALYFIDMEHEEILSEDEKQVSPMTKKEVEYLRLVLEADE